MKKESILILLVFLAGCGTYYGSGARTNTYYDDNYHSGSQGYDMRFILGNPPNLVYATSHGGNPTSDSFNIMMEVKNIGAYDVTRNHFVLSGFDSGIIQLAGSGSPWWRSNLDNLGVLRGRSPQNPIGEFDTLTWNVNRIVLPDGTDRFHQRFMVSACYDYRTEASVAVCVDPNPWRIDIKEEVCNPRSVGISSGQGAPVAVTNVDIIPMQNKVQMKIEIANIGYGQVIKSGTIIPGSVNYNKCPHNLDFKDLNWVYVNAQLSQAGPCIPQPNPVLLVNNRGVFYCTFDLRNQVGQENAYMTALEVTLDYEYTQSIWQDVEIQAIPG